MDQSDTGGAGIFSRHPPTDTPPPWCTPRAGTASRGRGGCGELRYLTPSGRQRALLAAAPSAGSTLRLSYQRASRSGSPARGRARRLPLPE
eukprot:627420-Prorocentrum_minimum.AAC.1